MQAQSLRGRSEGPTEVVGSRLGYEVRVLGRDGRYRWTRWNARTVPQEQLRCAIGVDISDSRPDDDESASPAGSGRLPRTSGEPCDDAFRIRRPDNSVH